MFCRYVLSDARFRQAVATGRNALNHLVTNDHHCLSLALVGRGSYLLAGS